MPGEPTEVAVQEADDGWRAHVTVGTGRSATSHAVVVSRDVLERIAPKASPEELVRASFEFLLEREPKESILPELALEVIGRYFPEFEREVGARIPEDGWPEPLPHELRPHRRIIAP